MKIQVPLEAPKLKKNESQLPPILKKEDKTIFQNYLLDASNFKGDGNSLFFVHSESQISQVLKETSARKEPLTIQGALTGLTGAAVPEKGAILTLEKLNNYSEIILRGTDTSAFVEPGVLLKDFQDYAESKGLFYTPDPTERSAWIGGTVATNASGARSYKYGATRPHVKSLRLVLSSGEVLVLKRGQYIVSSNDEIYLERLDQTTSSFKIPSYCMPPIKHAAGYYVTDKMDLIDLIIGSEGTLGVISEVELNLIPLPEKFVSLMIFFENEDDVLKCVREAKSKTNARALEYFDSFSLDFIRGKFKRIPEQANSALFVEEEITDGSEDRVLESWFELMEIYRAIIDQSWVGTTREKHEEMIAFRHEVPVVINEIMSRRGFRKIATDMAVPDEALEEMMLYYRMTINEVGLQAATFGHIGNNHLHVNLMPKSQKEFDVALELYKKWMKKVIDLKGTVSAEHGIGKIKVPYLEMMYGEEAIKEMIQIKKAFDPDCVLGRGTLFREELLE